MVGDLRGALVDLTATLEIDCVDYRCLKHRGYVKYLLGTTYGARMDAKRCWALGYKQPSYHFLGGFTIDFLDFICKNGFRSTNLLFVLTHVTLRLVQSVAIRPKIKVISASHLVDDEEKEVTDRTADISTWSQGNLPEGLFHELPDSEVVDKSALSSETNVQGDEDLDDLQKQLEVLNAP
ncbi:unnamed protein product [Calypogeia fissa]